MTEALHKAVQYLCCAAKSYLEAQPDDSHTNLGWDKKLQALISRKLGAYQEYSLALNFRSFSLEFLDERNDVVSSIYLEGADHVALVNWIGEEAMRLEIGELYNFDLHYELPYSDFNKEFVFPEPDYNELERLIMLRDIVQSSIEHILNTFDVESDIRIWPHHFDTGAVISIDGEIPRSIGLGLAIADNMVQEAYHYVSGWSADNSLILDGLKPLTYGNWKHPDWNGAVLEADDATEKQVMTFMIEAVQAIQQRSALV